MEVATKTGLTVFHYLFRMLQNMLSYQLGIMKTRLIGKLGVQCSLFITLYLEPGSAVAQWWSA